MMNKMAKKQSKKSCATPGCRNAARKKQNFCNTCTSRKQRAANPMLYAYRTLRSNAKRRKKPCLITFEDFKEFCYEYDYMAGKGRTAESFSIDCIIDELGYVKGNLQKLEVGENSRKYQLEKARKKVEYDWQHGGFTTVKVEVQKTIDGPF